MPPKRKAADKATIVKRSKVDDATPQNLNLIADKLFGCADVVAILFSFLDLRQLLLLACTSRGVEATLEYGHVVRATMLSGGYPQTSLERMLGPVRERKIWVPSPLRLLRVVCGKKCEVCNVPTRYVCKAFALFLCENCLTKSTKLLRRNKQWRPYLEAPGVMLGPRKGNRSPHSFLISKPFEDKCGNRIGPLVTSEDIEAMEHRKGGDAYSDDTSATEEVAAFVEECNDQQPNAETARQAILKAPGDNRRDVKNRQAALAALKQEKKKITGKKLIAKRQKCDEIIQKLVVKLNDDQDLIAKMEARQWSLRVNSYEFRDPRLEKILGKALRAPSKLNSQKKLQEVSDAIYGLNENKRLGLHYIQQIMTLVDHKDAAEVIQYRWVNWRRCYYFHNKCISEILEDPLEDPKSLDPANDIPPLAARAKKIVMRKEQTEEILKTLQTRLEGLRYANDLCHRTWQSQSWSYKFTETYVHNILHEPLLSAADITDEKLNELEKQLRNMMEKMEQNEKNGGTEKMNG
ncbi:unnamed protein product [Cylindrotheca closterium]|uniref:Uncharacterized protein n=1 Tax=Cylindrotheca closterium TaxID=2856 RepID=A0AAD2JM66_9STRA|nr:unnamed protein product [Cylindrotheca closterium]